MIDLDNPPHDGGAYLDRLGAEPFDWRISKTAEEGCEVVDASIKRTQSRVTAADLQDELGTKPSELIARRWAGLLRGTSAGRLLAWVAA
ncbi:Uncharacterised protein [Mycobacteroides abscessus subsp. abscessus]|uniref:hypothetical protein n=1 Tax=Mycobacteroides abscessus TaxID=36809 RepID=UPI000929A633|nr:hypothetical protein [Mycobacteroides abscessus]SIH22172.1 Uncharacterised protein [Mycobacteroides abscessus subsp. abscessus]